MSGGRREVPATCIWADCCRRLQGESQKGDMSSGEDFRGGEQEGDHAAGVLRHKSRGIIARGAGVNRAATGMNRVGYGIRERWVRHAGRQRCAVRKNMSFGQKHLPTRDFYMSISSSYPLDPDRWVQREGYGGPNLDEKGF